MKHLKTQPCEPTNKNYISDPKVVTPNEPENGIKTLGTSVINILCLVYTFILIFLLHDDSLP